MLKSPNIWGYQESLELRFHKATADFTDFDPMLSQKYSELNQDIFTIDVEPEPF
jgi:hypothetical protein